MSSIPVFDPRFMSKSMDFVKEVRAEQLAQKRAQRKAQAGQNMANALADLDVVFPWEAELRAFSPIVEQVAHLRAYWYRAGMRWVLYECIPLSLLPRDDQKVRADLTGEELFAAFAGKPPRERGDDEEPSPISDLQHEMARRFQVWAGPLWVLQGSQGGHVWRMDPQTESVMARMGKQTEMPAIGSLPACPWDQRTVTALQQRNKLAQLGGSLERLRKSGSAEARAIEEAMLERAVRKAEMDFIEAQMEPVVDMALSLVRGSNTRSEYDNQIVRVDGMAGAAEDAYARYLDTGDFTLKF